MRTTTAILLAVCFSSLIFTGLAADTMDITVTDGDTATKTFPASLTNIKSGSTAQAVKTSGTAVTSPALSTAATAVTDNTYTLAFASGFPVKTTIATVATSGANTNAASDFVVINLATGSQIVTVAGTANSKASGSSQTSFTTSNACGDYIYNGASGLLSVFFTSGCSVVLQQVAGVVGALQYNEASTSITQTQQGNILTALNKVVSGVSSANGAVANIVGSSSGSTIFYYQVPSLTTQQSSDISTAIQNAINSKSLKADGVTLLNGFASPITASQSASTSAPSLTAAATSAAAQPKAHNRMVVIVGVSSTITAALLGLAF